MAADVWRHVASSTINSGALATSPAPTYVTPADRLAVARGRMRAGAFPEYHDDEPPLEPLAKLYMDFAGPVAVPSVAHGPGVPLKPPHRPAVSGLTFSQFRCLTFSQRTR